MKLINLVLLTAALTAYADHGPMDGFMPKKGSMVLTSLPKTKIVYAFSLKRIEDGKEQALYQTEGIADGKTLRCKFRIALTPTVIRGHSSGCRFEGGEVNPTECNFLLKRKNLTTGEGTASCTHHNAGDDYYSVTLNLGQ